MILDSWAEPIVKTATKAFKHNYHPNKPTFQLIFNNHWDEFLALCKEKNISIPQYKIDEVKRMMVCGTLDMGFEVYECPNCHRHHIICYTCKSRFCPSCGTKLTRARAYRIANSTLDVNHRHMVFTIDERLRDYFWKNPEWLNFLFDATKEAIFYTFTKSKNSTDKSPKKKKRRRKKKSTLTPGFIITLHTYGRDLKWNPHLHVLCTEGAMNQDHTYKSVKYLHYESFRKSFMKQILDKMKVALQSNTEELRIFQKLVNTIYKEKTNGFYVNAPPNDMKKSGKDQVVKYMIRYAGKPAMAQSRIISYVIKLSNTIIRITSQMNVLKLRKIFSDSSGNSFGTFHLLNSKWSDTMEYTLPVIINISKLSNTDCLNRIHINQIITGRNIIG